jgi:hypothetical protein
VVELEKEVRALQEEIKERILEEARNKESRDKENREREEKEREREMREKEREREVFETPSPSESQKNLRDSDSVSADKGERERERDTANGNDEEKKCNTFSSPHASTDVSACSHLYYNLLCVDLCIYAVPLWPLNSLSWWCVCGYVCVCVRVCVFTNVFWIEVLYMPQRLTCHRTVHHITTASPDLMCVPLLC